MTRSFANGTLPSCFRRPEAPRATKWLAWLAFLWTLLVSTSAFAQPSASDAFTRALSKGPFFAGLAAFIGGFLVSLTPCVYPMIAITVSVFGAREAKSRVEGMLLSSVFVLGIAAMFTPLGVIAGMTGNLFGAALASRWVIIAVSVIFLVLAANLFGAFEMILPNSLMARLSEIGGAGWKGAFALGMVSGIIAAPCTGPVLTGILVWIGKTQSIPLGVIALLAFSLGLGVPFWIVGTFAVELPKSGKWMVAVKSLFGVVMVVVALYFLKNTFPVLLAPVRETTTFALVCTALVLLGLALGAVHLSFDGTLEQKLRKGLGVLLTVGGAFLLIGWIQRPAAELPWLHDEPEARQLATREHRPLLIDFTATWCGACQELAKHTFADLPVRREAERFVALKFDASHDDDPVVSSVLKKYDIHGLPTVILFDGNGVERRRFTDFVPADQFLPAIEAVQ